MLARAAPEERCSCSLKRIPAAVIRADARSLKPHAEFAGLDVREVQRLAGHRDLRTTQRYVDALKRSNRTVSSLLRRVFSEIRDELDDAA